MTTVVVESQKRIARNIEIVRKQFSDMEHHERTSVHSALKISNVRPSPTGYLFTGRRRVLGLVQEDEIEVTRQIDGAVTLKSLGGANVGLLITQTFEAVDPKTTMVRSVVELPLRGFMQILAPLIRVGVRRDQESALEEESVDLEDRAYPTPKTL
jgi:hypothetical protein